jgi:SHS2 domain-containing protein
VFEILIFEKKKNTHRTLNPNHLKKEMNNWEALPKRKKAKIGHTATGAAMTTTGESSGPEKNTALSITDQIAENIASRSKQNRQHNTLESKDGCANENYECMEALSSFVVILLYSRVDLDHTADVQCHAWGKNMKEAFEKMAECMMNYMTDLSLIEIDPLESREMIVKGHDLESLLYNYMNELLFKFITDSFCVREVEISEFDREKFEIKAKL